MSDTNDTDAAAETASGEQGHTSGDRSGSTGGTAGAEGGSNLSQPDDKDGLPGSSGTLVP